MTRFGSILAIIALVMAMAVTTSAQERDLPSLSEI